MAAGLGALSHDDIGPAFGHELGLLDGGDHRHNEHIFLVGPSNEISGISKRDAQHRNPFFEENLELLRERRGRRREILLPRRHSELLPEPVEQALHQGHVPVSRLRVRKEEVHPERLTRPCLDRPDILPEPLGRYHRARQHP